MRYITAFRKILYWLRINHIPLLFITAVITLAIYSSCANPGVPQGGPIDSIPPVVVKSIPAENDINIVESKIAVTFDEYVVLDNLRDKLVVSPPLKKSIKSKLKGKTVLVDFDEDLRPGMTYSVDFQDGIKDNNQGNVLEDFRIRFSTGSTIDTLQLSGYVLDAFTLEPLEKISVVFYQNSEDSLFTTTTPDYLARSNVEGEFYTNNLRSETYKVCAVEDGDNNLYFSQSIERIGFLDSLVLPSAEYIHQPDTIIEGNDTIAIHGYTNFFPDPFYIRIFTEEVFNQYILENDRKDSIRMSLYMNEATTDSFKVELVGYEEDFPDWAYIESSEDGDSIEFWITEPEVYKDDSLYLAVNYIAFDSLKRHVTYVDTLKYFMPKKKKEDNKKKKKDEEEELVVPTFKFKSNIKGSGFDLNQFIVLNTNNPVEKIDTSMVHLELIENDSTFIPLEYEYICDSINLRKFVIKYPWKSETAYRLVMDSACAVNAYGIVNDPLTMKFTTRNIEYYGTLSFNIDGFEGAGIVQLLKGSKEEIVSQQYIDSTKREVRFEYLGPQTVIAKLIHDSNGNKQWDTGNYEKKLQPEKVYYFPRKMTLKSNFEFVEQWLINPDEVKIKEIVDPNAEKEERGEGGPGGDRRGGPGGR